MSWWERNFGAAITSRVQGGLSACCGAQIETHSGMMSSYPRCTRCLSRVG